LQAAVEQRRRELGEAQATVSSLVSSVALAQRQVEMIEPLARKNIVPQTELLSARRELVDLQGRLAAAREGVSRTSAGVREAMAQAAEAGFQFRQDALNERSQLQTKIAVNSESLRGAAGRVQRAELRSPVDGVVNDVQVTTVGGFVQAGQKIMQVVPLGDKLLVEARVKPSDIAFIKVNDRANVKVTAYDFSVYGGLTGRVVQISADSIYDEVAKEAYFSVVVETDRAYLLSGQRRLPITPGMICDVEIITGRKSILSYLMKPISKARAEALSER
jgi:adhesin transport system membrane fusion protein